MEKHVYVKENKDTELREINRSRRLNGMPPLIAGPRQCLKCDVVFDSKDVRNNRMCSSCAYEITS